MADTPALNPITNDELAEAARDYQAASGEQGSVTNRTIEDMIKARNDALAQQAAAAGRSGLIYRKHIPGGCG